MNNGLIEDLKDVASKDWNVYESEHKLSLECFSNAGENIVVEIDTDCSERDIWKQVYCKWENFNVDEEVKMWIKNGSELSVQTLLDGANEKDRMLCDLKDKFYSKIKNYAINIRCESVTSWLTGEYSTDVCYSIFTSDGDVEYKSEKIFCAECYAEAVDNILYPKGYYYDNPYSYPNEEEAECYGDCDDYDEDYDEDF